MNRFNYQVRRYFTTNFNVFLTFLILLFIFRPYDRGGVYIAVWELWFVGAVLAAIWNCKHTPGAKTAALIFGLPGLLLHWVDLLYPHPLLNQAYLFFSVIFISICAGSIITRVILNAKVTLETLRGVICVYFLIAFAFAFAYLFIEFLIPGSFRLPDLGASYYVHNHYLSEMMYFSFVTLLTIGYGDIIALKDIAQTVTILEGIIGQFYIAILVARLVSVYSFYEHKQEIKEAVTESK